MTAAMILFVYQVADRTFVYFDYNTTVSVDIRYLDEVPFPAVTLCNINTFRLENLDLYECHFKEGDVPVSAFVFSINKKCSRFLAQFGIYAVKLIKQSINAFIITSIFSR